VTAVARTAGRRCAGGLIAAACSAGRLRLLFALFAGIATVFGFAPFSLAGMPLLTLALLFVLWQRATPGAAACLGFAFGAGLFGAGVSWIYLALNTFGGMPAPLATVAIGGLCVYLALFPALCGFVACRLTPPDSGARALAGAGSWTLAEWARSFVLSGFPWLSVGHAQLPAGSATPLAGYAPLGGTFLVTLACALVAAALARWIAAAAQGAWRRSAPLVAAIGLLVLCGGAVDRLEWTRPTLGTEVSLLQGNVTQERKFDPEFRERTFALYLELAAASRGQLIVLPESAFPVFADEVPDAVLAQLRRTVAARGGDVLLGLFTADPPFPGSAEPRYYNTVLSLGTGRLQAYRKRHLVPFGETIPAEAVLGAFVRNVLSIPLASQTPGEPDQAPMEVAGQRVAVNICYEDAFGSVIRSQAASATLLVNVTNDAWYGRSLAAAQHNQIAAMRAKEAGRPLLRATNTGITAAVGHDGRELARLPWFESGVLEIEISGREGVTPYVRYGDGPAAVLALGLVSIAARGRRSAARLAG
jgi:apolipoprotein N-acyltransferase